MGDYFSYVLGCTPRKIIAPYYSKILEITLGFARYEKNFRRSVCKFQRLFFLFLNVAVKNACNFRQLSI